MILVTIVIKIVGIVNEIFNENRQALDDSH